MKFVKESEKCPNKTAKMDVAEDNNDTERSIMIQALFCYFLEKKANRADEEGNT